MPDLNVDGCFDDILLGVMGSAMFHVNDYSDMVTFVEFVATLPV